MFEAQLKDVPFFGKLSKRELATIAQQTDELDVEPGKVLARQGEFGHEFFMILDGTAEVLRDGNDTPIAELGPGEFFGEMALLDEERRTATVRAITQMKVLVMNRNSFRTIDRSMPQVHETVARAINERRAAQQPAPAG